MTTSPPEGNSDANALRIVERKPADAFPPAPQTPAGEVDGDGFGPPRAKKPVRRT
jgi:hypothetical protein